MSNEEITIQLRRSVDGADWETETTTLLVSDKRHKQFQIASDTRILWNTNHEDSLDWDVCVLSSNEKVDVVVRNSVAGHLAVGSMATNLGPGGVLVLRREVHIGVIGAGDPWNGADEDIAEIAIRESNGLTATVRGRFYKLGS